MPCFVFKTNYTGLGQLIKIAFHFISDEQEKPRLLPTKNVKWFAHITADKRRKKQKCHFYILPNLNCQFLKLVCCCCRYEIKIIFVIVRTQPFSKNELLIFLTQTVYNCLNCQCYYNDVFVGIDVVNKMMFKFALMGLIKQDI